MMDFVGYIVGFCFVCLAGLVMYTLWSGNENN